MLCLTPVEFVGLARFLEAFGGELADRFQHPVAALPVTHQALVNQRLQDVEACSRDRFCRLELITASEDGESRK